MVKAVIFDMDGVLIDSEPFWSEAEQFIFQQLGVKLDPAVTSQTAGMSTKAVTELWFRHSPWTGMSLVEAEQAVIQYVADAVVLRGTAKAGLIPLLQQLQDAGVPLAVATNSPSSLLHTVLEHLDIRQYFQAWCSIEDVRQGKPAPDIYHLAASKLGVPNAECLVFEDSITGMTAALAAGMRVIALPADHHWHKADYQQAVAKLRGYQGLCWQQITELTTTANCG